MRVLRCCCGFGLFIRCKVRFFLNSRFVQRHKKRYGYYKHRKHAERHYRDKLARKVLIFIFIIKFFAVQFYLPRDSQIRLFQTIIILWSIIRLLLIR